MIAGDRRGFLRVLGACPEQWAKRYGLEPCTHPCYRCGASLTTTVPFAKADFRGLIAPVCACGFEGGPYCIVRVSGDLFERR